MEQVRKFKDRLKRILNHMPPNAANIPLVIERVDELYIKMLEEANALMQSTTTKRKRKPEQVK